MPRVLVTSTGFSRGGLDAVHLLQAAGVQVVLKPSSRPLDDHELATLLGDFDGIIAGVDHIGAQSLHAGSPRLKVIARYGIGCDTVDVDTATGLGIVVTNTPGANSEAVADLVFGFLISLARQLLDADRMVRGGQWQRLMGRDLPGKRLGLVEFGRVARAVARRALGFELQVCAHDIVWNDAVAHGLNVTPASLESILETCDYISLHVPHTPRTHHLIGEQALRRMQPTAFLVNTSRGELVDEQALTRALREGWIAGAALDVFEREPPVGSDLLSAPNTLFSPHIGASTHDAAAHMARMAAENLLAVLQGRRPDHVVNPQVYGRAE